MEALRRLIHPNVQRVLAGNGWDDFWDVAGEDETEIRAVFYESLAHSVESEMDCDGLFAQLLGAMHGLEDESYEMMGTQFMP